MVNNFATNSVYSEKCIIFSNPLSLLLTQTTLSNLIKTLICEKHIEIYIKIGIEMIYNQ